MALRFILNNPTVSTIIPGMRKLANVERNIRAAIQGPLPVDLHTELASIVGTGRPPIGHSRGDTGRVHHEVPPLWTHRLDGK